MPPGLTPPAPVSPGRPLGCAVRGSCLCARSAVRCVPGADWPRLPFPSEEVTVDVRRWDPREWPAGCVTATPDLQREQGCLGCLSALVIGTHSGPRWRLTALLTQAGWAGGGRPDGALRGVLGCVWCRPPFLAGSTLGPQTSDLALWVGFKDCSLFLPPPPHIFSPWCDFLLPQGSAEVRFSSVRFIELPSLSGLFPLLRWFREAEPQTGSGPSGCALRAPGGGRGGGIVRGPLEVAPRGLASCGLCHQSPAEGHPRWNLPGSPQQGGRRRRGQPGEQGGCLSL